MQKANVILQTKNERLEMGVIVLKRELKKMNTSKKERSESGKRVRKRIQID